MGGHPMIEQAIDLQQFGSLRTGENSVWFWEIDPQNQYMPNPLNSKNMIGLGKTHYWSIITLPNRVATLIYYYIN